MGCHKEKQLKFEDYLSFFGNRHADNLIVRQLKKEEICIAASSLNLIRPSRFGLSDGNILLVPNSMPALSLEEAKHGIQEIGWEECPVGSILTIDPTVFAFADNLSSTLISQKKRRGNANRSTTDKRSNLQITVAEKGAKEDVKELSKYCNSCEKSTIQVLAKSSKNADPYTWHASGSMKIIGLPCNRLYYKCSEIGCFAKKHVDRDANDPSMCTITYKGKHNHSIL